jgi:5'-nucleotidase / UDP-sugar diphosphatase
MAITLQILHASDLEAGIAALQDAPRFSAVINGLKAQYPEQTLILSSGDNYIPGPFLVAGGDASMRSVLGREGTGRADIVIANNIGFQASAFGNHEFDLGTATIGSLINSGNGYVGTAFPYLSANLDFTNDSNLAGFVVADGQAPQPKTIAKSTVIQVQEQPVGIVGATTPLLPSISSPGEVVVSPANPEDFDALAATIQPAIDALVAQGINKIILLSHMQQLQVEVELASRLRNVDVIIAGGSHTLLADSTDRLRVGDTSGGVYPILETSANGEPVAIVNTGANYEYVGRLVAQFDDNGVLIPSSIDPNISGAYATDEQGVTDTGNAAPNQQIVAVTDALSEVIFSKDGNTFGKTEVFLNGERNDVRTQETNFGNITADANLFAAQKVDPSVVISIKNGGGIRASIGAVVGSGGNDPNAGQKTPPVGNPEAGKEAGEISQLDIENSLRFNNTLTLLTLNAAQLKQVIEHGVAATAPGATPGQFPQVGGMEFSFDASLPVGSRVISLG